MYSIIHNFNKRNIGKLMGSENGNELNWILECFIAKAEDKNSYFVGTSK